MSDLGDTAVGGPSEELPGETLEEEREGTQKTMVFKVTAALEPVSVWKDQNLSLIRSRPFCSLCRSRKERAASLTVLVS